ncbi:MAG: CehA/McbA family metallohydrolase [Candidatus Eisenbacteria bacterium]|nr:CehA/McbA family metallohydrolase [Candidatus Eisenbacteria bacterium]
MLHRSIIGAALCLVVANVAEAHLLTLQVRDANAQPLHARVHVIDGTGASYPPAADSLAMSYYGGDHMRAYFYTAGDAVMDLPTGATTVTIGHGFEHRPRRFTLNLSADDTLTVTMPREIDMASLGWFSGDNHVHTYHQPLDYHVDPAEAHRICAAEDLNLTWLLDNGRYFIGGPDPTSTPNCVTYYATEHRNQAFGHVALLGLKDNLSLGCCTPPEAAYPMLTDLREEWAPQPDEAMSLCHPINGAGFFDDGGWPAWGLGREIPVMAALGALDSYDIVSYGNAGDVQVADWYRLLNCGFRIPASAGTDCRINSYFMRPAGGFRTYVKQPGMVNDPSAFVQNLRQGKSFVTNYPLLLDFMVDGQEAGSMINMTGPSGVVSVHFRVVSLLGVGSAKIIRNGEIVQTIPLSQSSNGTDQVVDTTVQILGSSWIAVRIDGMTAHQTAVNNQLFAHSSPVYVYVDSTPQQSTVDAGYFRRWIDDLMLFVEMRGGWVNEDDRLHVFQRLDDARSVYRNHFHFPPGSFSLLSPSEGDTVAVGGPIHFDWTDAVDPEAGDRVRYQLTIASDSLFITGISQPLVDESELVVSDPLLIPNRTYWWRVKAIDYGNLTTMSTPTKRRFIWRTNPVDTPDADLPSGAGHERLTAWIWPNPSGTDIGIRPSRPLDDDWTIDVLSVDGRRVAALDQSGGPSAILRRPDGVYVWRTRDDQGRRMPSGSYFIRLAPRHGSGADVIRQRVLLIR